MVSTNEQGIKLETGLKTETASNSKCEPMNVQESTIKDAANDTKPVVSMSVQGIKREPSTHAQRIKLEPGLKTEAAPAPTSLSPSSQGIKRDPFAGAQQIKREASIPTDDAVINGPNPNRTFTVRQKVAKRTNPLYLAPPPPQNTAYRYTSSPPPTCTVVASTRRQNSRRVNTTSSAVTSAPPLNATVVVPTLRQSQRKIQLPLTETSEAKLDDDDSNDDDDDLLGSSWEDGLSELANYRKIHGHCNFPQRYPENTKLGNWVDTQRVQYRLHVKRKTSRITTFRIQELESFDFEWDIFGAPWKESLSGLTEYHSIHGHCNVPSRYSKNIKLGFWVSHQRRHYRLHREGKKSRITLPRILTLESFGFERDILGAAWQDRLSELTDYHSIRGHCNVPKKCYSENFKLGTWVSQQRLQYKLHLEGKKSQMTLPRSQTLESLGFEWDILGAAWKESLSELADYRKLHGHCNVSGRNSENSKLGEWVATQRVQYRLHVEEKTSHLTTYRNQILESFGFEWDIHGAVWEDRFSELVDYHSIHGNCNVPRNYSENSKLANWVSHQKWDYRLHREGKKA